MDEEQNEEHWAKCFAAWHAMGEAGLMDGGHGSEWRENVVAEFMSQVETVDDAREQLYSLLVGLSLSGAFCD